MQSAERSRQQWTAIGAPMWARKKSRKATRFETSEATAWSLRYSLQRDRATWGAMSGLSERQEIKSLRPLTQAKQLADCPMHRLHRHPSSGGASMQLDGVCQKMAMRCNILLNKVCQEGHVRTDACMLQPLAPAADLILLCTTQCHAQG